MKTKSRKHLSILILPIILVTTAIQPAFSSHPGHRNALAQTSDQFDGPTAPAEFEAFLNEYLAYRWQPTSLNSKRFL
jgi:hypothetical protein